MTETLLDEAVKVGVAVLSEAEEETTVIMSMKKVSQNLKKTSQRNFIYHLIHRTMRKKFLAKELPVASIFQSMIRYR